jgi:hypothetical protein
MRRSRADITNNGSDTPSAQAALLREEEEERQRAPLYGEGVDWWRVPLLVSARMELPATWGASDLHGDVDRFESVASGGRS